MKTIFNLFTALAVILFICTENISAQNAAYQSSITQNLKSPVRFAIDASDNIYVTDGFQKSIIKYDASGNYLNSISVGISPLSIAINSFGQMFVSDGITGKIYKVESTGATTAFYSGCVFPSSMTFSPEGILYVADGELKKVIALDVSANVVQTIGLGTLVFPSEVVYDTRNSRILVAEHGGIGPGVGMSSLPLCKIWIFNLSGALQGSFATAGSTNGRFYRIQGMAIGKCGNLYVCDPYQGTISVFNENNTFLTRFGQFGTQPGQLNVPLDILFDSQERVIVASMNNGALEVFNVSDTLPTSNIANSDATICSNQTANITIDFTGMAPWTFSYTVNGLNPVSVTTSDNPYILTVNTGGIYEITALNDLNKTGTCFSGSAKITVNSAIPTTNISTVNAILCSGSTLNIPIQFTGTSPWTFTYTKDGVNPTTILTANNPYFLTTSDAGLYEVTAVSAGGCIGNTFVGNANISVSDLPSVNFISNNSSISICEGETAILPVEFTGTAPWTFTYTLNQNPLIFNSSTNTFDITASEAGIYEIINVSDANCMSNISQVTNEVVIKPAPTSLMSEVITTICEGASVQIPITFSGNAPFSFTYSLNDISYNTIYTNESQYLLNAVNAGIYAITSLNGDGCFGYNNTGSSIITVNPNPIVNLGVDKTICEDQNVLLDAGIHSSYLWSDNSTNQTLIVNQTGVYSVQVADVNGCVNVDVINVTVNSFVVSQFNYSENNLQVVFTNNSLNATSYIWDFGDGTSSTEVNPIHVYANPGSYNVTLTVSNGVCADNIISQIVNILSLNINNITIKNSVSVYPNPSNGIFTIAFTVNTQKPWTVEVLNTIGQIVYSNSYSRPTENVDLSSLSSGIYTVKIVSDEISKTEKLIFNK